MKPILIPALFCSLLFSAQSGQDLRKSRLIGVIRVGEVFQDCAHVRRAGRLAETPMGFIISPDVAFQRALDKVKFRCPSEFGNLIFADDDYYYITVGPVDSFHETAKRDITPAALRASTIRVHGLTGKVFPPNSSN
ncbi:hypothetical protein [Geothrix fuzhouensis]|uniref:hypothetical protein n=1 Tax=Geothrix fuzhouensis TaxID=2966451 RepID=UPI002147AE21|nr:hypothetical protein [Geothrix fuzhouensis]